MSNPVYSSAILTCLAGTIGTGLFVGSGQTLARGGPALILIAYLVMTLAVYCVVTALTEVVCDAPQRSKGDEKNLLIHHIRLPGYPYTDPLFLSLPTDMSQEVWVSLWAGM